MNPIVENKTTELTKQKTNPSTLVGANHPQPCYRPELLGPFEQLKKNLVGWVTKGIILPSYIGIIIHHL